jgi:hypothetical protein
MAWSEQARQAALAARKMKRRRDLYNPVPAGHGAHLSRGEMARNLRDMRRSAAPYYPGSPTLRNQAAVGMATRGPGGGRKRFFTSVKGAHFVDQGMGGKVWRYAGRPKYVPAWSATSAAVANPRLSRAERMANARQLHRGGQGRK